MMLKNEHNEKVSFIAGNSMETSALASNMNMLLIYRDADKALG